MRLAIISDIHANFEALRALADDLAGADRVLCLGDLVGYYCQVNEALDYVRGLDALCVIGNHDSFLLHGCPPDAPPAVQFGIEFADRVIANDHRQWLSGLPLVWAGIIDGRSFLLTHGSPWRPLDDYLYSDTPALGQLDAFAYDVIAFGQTHRAFWRLDRKPYLLNPGSIGQSRDARTRGYACALMLDTATMAVEPLERAFDVGWVMDLATRNGAGIWVSKHLC
jgi:putative phosphoesterase